MRTSKHEPRFHKSPLSVQRKSSTPHKKLLPSEVAGLIAGVLSDDNNKESQEKLWEAHQGLVKRIAQNLVREKGIKDSLLEDLIQEGYLGLMDAVGKYDPSRNASFETYASIRVRGAMLDFLRHDTPITKEVMRVTRDTREASENLAQMLLREPLLAELKQALPPGLREKFEQAQLLKWQRTPISLLHIEDGEELDFSEIFPDSSVGAGEKIDRDRVLGVALMTLMAFEFRDRTIIFWRYMVSDDEVVSQKELSKRLGISESRVSQIEKELLKRLRLYLVKCNFSMCF